MLGSIDANSGESPYSAGTPIKFNTDARELTVAMLSIPARRRAWKRGALNFDAKLRRTSVDPEGPLSCPRSVRWDTYATRRSKIAHRILDRGASFDSFGPRPLRKLRRRKSARTSRTEKSAFRDLERYVLQGAGEVQLISGKQGIPSKKPSSPGTSTPAPLINEPLHRHRQRQPRAPKPIVLDNQRQGQVVATARAIPSHDSGPSAGSRGTRSQRVDRGFRT